MVSDIHEIIKALFMGMCGYVTAIVIAKKNRSANAALIYRSSIVDIDKITELRGHALHNALVQTFPGLKKAVHEYRLHLCFFKRRRFNRAWRDYHGGDEDNPDFFVMYCVHDDSSLLTKRLDQLKKVGGTT